MKSVSPVHRVWIESACSSHEVCIKLTQHSISTVSHRLVPEWTRLASSRVCRPKPIARGEYRTAPTLYGRCLQVVGSGRLISSQGESIVPHRPCTVGACKWSGFVVGIIKTWSMITTIGKLCWSMITTIGLQFWSLITTIQTRPLASTDRTRSVRYDALTLR